MRKPSTLQPGQQLAGKYEIVSSLGDGAMGSVYRAIQHPIGRHVAIKVLHPGLAVGMAQRFDLEARAISQLHHPNTITLIDYGVADDGQLFMATELLSGQPLDQVLASQRRLEPERVIRIAHQIAAALAEAHQKGLLHRDIKPSNIFVSDVEEDHVKVLDFGIAKLLDADAEKLTRVGYICGTPEYMAPEQSRDGTLDGRTDLYALGVMMWEMLQGRLPYRSGSPLNTVTKHQTAPIPPLHAHVPDSLAAFVYRAMAKAPEDRPADAAAFIRELESAGIAAASEGPAAPWEGPGLQPATAPSLATAPATQIDAPIAGAADTPTAPSTSAGPARTRVALVAVGALLVLGAAVAAIGLAMADTDEPRAASPDAVPPAALIAATPDQPPETADAGREAEPPPTDVAPVDLAPANAAAPRPAPKPAVAKATEPRKKKTRQTDIAQSATPVRPKAAKKTKTRETSPYEPVE